MERKLRDVHELPVATSNGPELPVLPEPSEHDAEVGDEHSDDSASG
jgi:hypothetical protein